MKHVSPFLFLKVCKHIGMTSKQESIESARGLPLKIPDISSQMWIVCPESQ